MTLTIVPSTKNTSWYDPRVVVNDPVVYQNINLANGNLRSSSVTAHRYLQDMSKRLLASAFKEGFSLSVSGTNVDIASGHAFINGRWVFNDATYNYDFSGHADGTYYLYIEVTEQAEGESRDIFSESINFNTVLTSSYVAGANKLILGKITVATGVPTIDASFSGSNEVRAAQLVPPVTSDGSSYSSVELYALSGQDKQLVAKASPGVFVAVENMRLSDDKILGIGSSDNYQILYESSSGKLIIRTNSGSNVLVRSSSALSLNGSQTVYINSDQSDSGTADLLLVRKGTALSQAFRIKNDGTAIISGSLEPLTNATYNIGSTTGTFSRMYAYFLRSNQLKHLDSEIATFTANADRFIDFSGFNKDSYAVNQWIRFRRGGSPATLSGVLFSNYDDYATRMFQSGQYLIVQGTTNMDETGSQADTWSEIMRFDALDQTTQLFGTMKVNHGGTTFNILVDTNQTIMSTPYGLQLWYDNTYSKNVIEQSYSTNFQSTGDNTADYLALHHSGGTVGGHHLLVSRALGLAVYYENATNVFTRRFKVNNDDVTVSKIPFILEQSSNDEFLRLTTNGVGNIVIQNLVGGNDGFSVINWNGYYDTAEVVLNTNKLRWRLGVDQRSTKDKLFIDSYDSSTSTLKNWVELNSVTDVIDFGSSVVSVKDTIKLAWNDGGVSPAIQFNAGDWFGYSPSSDLFKWVIGSTTIASLNSTTLNLYNGSDTFTFKPVSSAASYLDIALNSSTMLRIRASGNTSHLASSLAPMSDLSSDLGLSTYFWRDLYIQKINIKNQSTGADPYFISSYSDQKLALYYHLLVRGYLQIMDSTSYYAIFKLSGFTNNRTFYLPDVNGNIVVDSSSYSIANTKQVYAYNLYRGPSSTKQAYSTGNPDEQNITVVNDLAIPLGSALPRGDYTIKAGVTVTAVQGFGGQVKVQLLKNNAVIADSGYINKSTTGTVFLTVGTNISLTDDKYDVVLYVYADDPASGVSSITARLDSVVIYV